jgi:enoyl-CoA hydratase/carnithine racemase
MTDFVQTSIVNHIGFITLNRVKAHNSLSLDMVRAITVAMLNWRHQTSVTAVVIKANGGKAFCAGGDIRFFYDVGSATPQGGSALLEDFFTEEYALNHLIHHYPKPYIALMDGIVMGGGMGIAQAGPHSRLRIVTERTKMAMPEVNIGLFPDVGGSYFLARTPGCIGSYLGLSGETIGAADAIYAQLADLFLPSSHLPELITMLESAKTSDPRTIINDFCAPFASQAAPETSMLAAQRGLIDRHFSLDQVSAITASLAEDDTPFAQKTLAAMRKRSPLMMCVTREQLRRGAEMDVADCLRMERSMVRYNFEHGEVIEGVRALVIDKDYAPQWSPPSLDMVTPEMIERFFTSAWPAHAHPLREFT